MEEKKKAFKPLPGQDERGVDLTQIRQMLALTPEERIRHGAAAARNLDRLLAAIRRK